MTRLSSHQKLLLNHKTHWLVMVGILAAFALYLYQIDAQSLWRDEVLSIGRAQQPTALIFINQNFVGDVASPDLHPPFYFLLLHGWHRLTGDSEFVWRYVSVLAMVLALAMFYAAGNRIGGRSVGWWAFLLAWLSPFFLWYAQEARMYALVVGQSLAVLLATWTLLERPFTWKNTVWFTLAAAVLVFTHYSGLFLVAFAILALGLAQLYRKRRFSPRLFLVPFLGGMVVLWLLLPNVIELLSAPGFVAFSQRPLSTLALEAINTFSLGSAAPMADPGWRIWPFILLGLLGAGSSVYAANIRRRHAAWFIISAFIIPLLSIYLAAWLQANYSNPRHLTILSAAWFLLMGQGLTVLYRRWPPLAIAALVVVGMAGGPALYQTVTDSPIKKDDVRGLAAYIEERMQPGDLVIWHDAVMMEVYEYYATNVPFTAVPLYGQHDEAAIVQRLSSQAAQYKRIWFVEKPAPFFFDKTLVSSWLDAHLARANFQTFVASWTSLQLRLYVWPEYLTELPPDTLPADLSQGSYRIEGILMEETAVSGQGTWLSVIWSGGEANSSPPATCIRLRDSTDVLWADGCTNLTLPDGQTLSPDQMMASQLWLDLPSGLAPTRYQMELVFGETTQTISSIPVVSAEATLNQSTLVQYQNGLRLVDVSWGSSPFQAGLWAVGSLVWQTKASLPADLQVSVRLVDALGRSTAVATQPLGPADYPTEQWQPGQLVRSLIGVQLPFAADGRYRVQISVNETEGTAVPQTGLLNRTWATIDTVQVAPWLIIRELPPTATPLEEDVFWGETVRLRGYEIVRKGQILTVKLYWLIDEETAVDYVVFVHVGSPSAPPLAQSSSRPANWTRPVASWQPGEIIEDVHTITLPADLPADAAVSIGMLDVGKADTRVPVTAVDQPVPNAIWPLGPLPAP